MSKYIFTSERLGFRNWTPEDLPEFAALNADEAVMEHFPKTLSKQETSDFIERLRDHYDKNGHTYFAVEVIENNEFIGFVGLAKQDYDIHFNPSIDIGWRLKKSAWGKGYATEGAKRCLEFAFNDLKLDRVIATCTQHNRNSENVMQKIGMKRMGEFMHPKLNDFPDYQPCIWYEVKNS